MRPSLSDGAPFVKLALSAQPLFCWLCESDRPRAVQTDSTQHSNSLQRHDVPGGGIRSRRRHDIPDGIRQR